MKYIYIYMYTYTTHIVVCGMQALCHGQYRFGAASVGGGPSGVLAHMVGLFVGNRTLGLGYIRSSALRVEGPYLAGQWPEYLPILRPHIHMI